MPALRPGDRGYTGYGQVRGDPVAPLDPFDGDHYDRQPWDPDDPSVDRRMGDDSEHDDPVEVAVKQPLGRPTPVVSYLGSRGDPPLQPRDKYDTSVDEDPPGEEPNTDGKRLWWEVMGYGSLAAAIAALSGRGGDGSGGQGVLSGDPADPTTPAGALNKVLDVISGLLGGGDQTQSQQVDIKDLVGDLAQTIGDISNHQEVNIDFDGLAEALKAVQTKGITASDVMKLITENNKGVTDVVGKFLDYLTQHGFPTDDPKDEEDTESALDKILETVGKITDLLTALNKAITEGRYFGLTPGERAARDDESRYPGTTPWERLGGAQNSEGIDAHGVQRSHERDMKRLDRTTQVRVAAISGFTSLAQEYVRQDQSYAGVQNAMRLLQKVVSGEALDLDPSDIYTDGVLTTAGMGTHSGTELNLARAVTEDTTREQARAGIRLIDAQFLTEAIRRRQLQADELLKMAQRGLITAQEVSELKRQGLIDAQTSETLARTRLADSQEGQLAVMAEYYMRSATSDEKQAAAAFMGQVINGWKAQMEEDRSSVNGEINPAMISNAQQLMSILRGDVKGVSHWDLMKVAAGLGAGKFLTHIIKGLAGFTLRYVGPGAKGVGKALGRPAKPRSPSTLKGQPHPTSATGL